LDQLSLNPNSVTNWPRRNPARYDAVRTAPTLEKRRKLARASFFPFLATVESAMYADAKRAPREDPVITGLRVAEHTRLNVWTLRDALGWNRDEAWTEFLKADPRGRDDDEAA